MVVSGPWKAGVCNQSLPKSRAPPSPTGPWAIPMKTCPHPTVAGGRANGRVPENKMQGSEKSE